MTASSHPLTEGRPSGPQLDALPWELFLSEMIGTGALVLFGLSLVILAFGAGSPIAALVPSVRLRQSITGFLFGCVGGGRRCLPSGR